MLITMFDQKQGPGFQRITLPFDLGNACAADYKQPLIGTAMAIARTTLDLTGLDDHLGRLTATVSQGNSKSFPEPKRFAFHRVFLSALHP
jgi:hypothetical protein